MWGDLYIHDRGVINLGYNPEKVTKVFGANPEDTSGGAIDVGDINGDGINDVIIGSSLSDPGARDDAGEVYAIKGFDTTSIIEVIPQEDGYANKDTDIKVFFNSDISSLTMDVVNTMEEKLIECQKQIYGIDLEKNSRESQISIIHDRRSEVNKRIESSEKKAETIRNKITELKEDFDQKETLINDYDRQIKEIIKNIESFETNINHSEERIERNDKIIRSNEEKINLLEEKNSEMQNNQKKLIDDIVELLDKNLKDYSTEKKQQYEQAIISIFKEIDISFKLKAYQLYNSQIRSYRSPEIIKMMARYRGEQGGFKFAEGYKVVRMCQERVQEENGS